MSDVRVTRRGFVRDGAGRRGGRRGPDAHLYGPGRQSGQGRHRQDPQLQPRHGVPPLRQDQPDGLGRVPGRALEADRAGRAAGQAGRQLDGRGTGQSQVRGEPLRRRHPLHRARHQLHRRLRGLRSPGLLPRRSRAAATRCTWASPGPRTRCACWGRSGPTPRKPASRWKPGWITKKLKECFDNGLKQAGLEYVDLWRITCHEGQQRPRRRRDGANGRCPGMGQERAARPASPASPRTTGRTSRG